MRHKVARSVLTFLLAAVAAFDFAQGILVLTGVYAAPVNYHGTPFTDATVPMLLVAIVIGGSSLLAAATVFMAIFVTSFSLMADAWRDALDPKLRGAE